MVSYVGYIYSDTSTTLMPCYIAGNAYITIVFRTRAPKFYIIILYSRIGLHSNLISHTINDWIFNRHKPITIIM